MGTFTVTLQEVIDLEGYKYPLPASPYAVVGLDKYPIFDEDYRASLNDKIIAHYNEQEIAHETIPMFRYAMARKMNEVMALFNQHYKVSQIEIDPLKTVDIKNVGENNETSETNSKSNAEGRVVGSNTPQVRLSGNKDYATNAQDSVSGTTADGTAEQTATSENTTSGYSGNPAELVWAMRQSFVNVDLMVIESLSELFMMVWDNGQEFTNTEGFYGYDTNPIYPFYYG